MRRITIWALSTLSALVLLFSYHTSTSSQALGTSIIGPLQAGTQAAGGTSGSGTGSGSGSGSGTTSGSGTGSGSGSSSGTTSGSGSGSGSTTTQGTKVTGDVVQTRWGAVQVEITISGKKIVSAQVLQIPWNNQRDMAINSYVVPIYNRDAVTTQSAKFDMISGATVTWQGYVASLQSAIDKANL